MYARPRPGEWVNPVQSGYRMECCSCGLVHSVDFDSVSGLGVLGTLILYLLRPRVLIRLFRDEQATNERRALRNSACTLADF